ncbi:MAG: metalloregulator ArsR/SmtB family transcription factor [Dehalococcoidales bacterium]|jgi:DNA-binding transcriptional ArsR family regulator
MNTEKGKIPHLHLEIAREVKGQLPGDEVYTELAETFGALADSNRAKIVHSLRGRELCVGCLAGILGISESAVSQHLRILRTLRLVRARKEGRLVYYALNDTHIETLLDVCLEHILHEPVD